MKTKKELLEENEALKAEILLLKEEIKNLKRKNSSLESEVYSRLTDRELIG